MPFIALFALSFLAGSFLPVGSEVYFILLKEQGGNMLVIVLAATLGNSLGGMTTYWIGRYGGNTLVHKYFKIQADKLELWQKRLHGKGAWVALLCWVPIVGEVIGAALGILCVNHAAVIVYMTVGKLSRYLLLWYLWS